MTFITPASARLITRKQIKCIYTYYLPLSTLRGIRTILPSPGFLQHPWPRFTALRIIQAER